MVFEDFVPISDSQSLITHGRRLTELRAISLAPYTVDDGGRVQVGAPTDTLAKGSQLRLGGLFDGRLIYSDRDNIVGSPLVGHQPFLHDGRLYYTAGAPRQRIYCDGVVVVEYFNGFDQVANPCIMGDWLYFEARTDAGPLRCDLWEIWRVMVGGGEPERVCQGANPSSWAGRLIVGEWNGRNFDYVVRDV